VRAVHRRGDEAGGANGARCHCVLASRPGMLDDNAIREQLSIAYIHAVASRAGFAWEATTIDRDSIDGRVRAKGLVHPGAILRSPSIAFQLKASTTVPDGDPIAFSLVQKNYDELRGHVAEPRYLGLLVLPPDPAEWLQLTPDALVLRRSMYWLGFAGAAESSNATATTVYIPRSNVLDGAAITKLLHSAAMQESL